MDIENLKKTFKPCSQSILNIIVQHSYEGDVDFCEGVVVALREYADAVERGRKASFDRIPIDQPSHGRRAMERMTASNGYEILVIAGYQSPIGHDHGLKDNPFASTLDRTEEITDNS